MRVLQIIDSLALGGAEVLVKDMVPRIRARGVDCELAVLQDGATPLRQTLEAAGVPVHATGIRKLYSPVHVSRLARLLPSFDLVHVHLFPAQLWTILGAWRPRRRVRVITTEHNPWNARRRWWLRPFDQWMYPHFDVIACNSEATADDLAGWCPGIRSKLTVIANGIPLEDFEMAPPADLPPLAEGMSRVVFVARFEPQKDHHTILRALQRVPRAHVAFVGDGPLRPDLETEARSLGIGDRVTFLGRRTDVARVLKASDIYVHSTNSDGFGIAACEAMAAGLPVIASNVPGLAQVVEGAGILFARGDDQALARELAALLDSPARRRAMSEASRRRARCYSIETTVDGYIQLYQSVLRASA